MFRKPGAIHVEGVPIGTHEPSGKGCIYRIRYEAVVVCLQSWLTAQETQRTTETTLTEIDRTLNYIDLVQILGGDTIQR